MRVSPDSTAYSTSGSSHRAPCAAHTIAALFLAGEPMAEHEKASVCAAAGRVAGRLGLDCETVTTPCREVEGRYWIPASTLSMEEAADLGIADESQLWGGVVPYAFVATKLVSHPRWDDSSSPAGWRDITGISDCTLPGYSVFSREAAAAAGKALLAGGAIRVKSPCERGGNGQSVLRSGGELREWLDATGDSAFGAGLVLERDLVDPITYSIGSSRLAGTDIAYHGLQHSVANFRGSQVYGGSTIRVVPGCIDDLRAGIPAGELAHVIDLAVRYDRSLREGYGIIATRRNYDVIAGVDENGVRHMGVLEQSWRFGGAGMAEVLAVERLADRTGCSHVIAETVESYGDRRMPDDVFIYWRGDEVSPRKYARILQDGC